jgi:hypothetical protein
MRVFKMNESKIVKDGQTFSFSSLERSSLNYFIGVLEKQDRQADQGVDGQVGNASDSTPKHAAWV